MRDDAGRQARAEVRRVLCEAAIEDESFSKARWVLDIGPGPPEIRDACPARVSIGVEPPCGAVSPKRTPTRRLGRGVSARGRESIPLVSDSVDVVVARNSLDHVDDPRAVLTEAQRLLRQGGTLILNFDADHAPTATEPHALSRETIRAAQPDMTIVHEQASPWPHGHEGQVVVTVARRSWTTPNPRRGARSFPAVPAVLLVTRGESLVLLLRGHGVELLPGRRPRHRARVGVLGDRRGDPALISAATPAATSGRLRSPRCSRRDRARRGCSVWLRNGGRSSRMRGRARLGDRRRNGALVGTALTEMIRFSAP